MDSSLCLASAIKEHGVDSVLALSFSYGQRHTNELKQAELIANYFKVDHKIININCLGEITDSALLNKTQKIETKNKIPNTMVVGRNGLMARVAAIHANHLGAKCIYMGVIEVEEANSGYRDCSRKYMDLVEAALRLDFDDQDFEIKTPLVKMTKKETMQLGYKLGVLEYLLENTITCYEGLQKEGCGGCPACKLRNDGIREFASENPAFTVSYLKKIL